VLFHRYGRTPRYRCKRCVGEAVTRRLRKVKQTLVDDFGGGCVICGYDRTPGSLHFHHVDPSTKAFSITMGSGRSLAAYREEARKCILVCANCHGEIEAGLIRSPPPGAKLRSLLSMLLDEADRGGTGRD
jgi:cytochrome c553